MNRILIILFSLIFIAVVASLLIGFKKTQMSSTTSTTPATNSTCSLGPLSYNVSINSGLDGLFNNYGNLGVGWTGGDGADSVRLPDGREVWMFSDTLLGQVTNGTRLPILAPTPLIHNSFVVVNGSKITTLYTNVSYPTAFIGTGNSSTWYWVAPGIVSGNEFQIILPEYRQAGSGIFGFTWIGTSLGTFSLPGISPISIKNITNRSNGSGVSWISWLLSQSNYTYIYGYKNTSMYIARVSGTDLSGSWEYFSSNGWSSDPSSAAPVNNDVSYTYSVIRMQNRYLLINLGPGLSNNLYIYSSCSPTGPFTNGTVVYTTPDQKEYNSSYGIITYGAIVHPEFTIGNRIVVSYNVLGTGPKGSTDVTVYRPRFINITIS